MKKWTGLPELSGLANSPPRLLAETEKNDYPASSPANAFSISARVSVTP